MSVLESARRHVVLPLVGAVLLALLAVVVDAVVTRVPAMAAGPTYLSGDLDYHTPQTWSSSGSPYVVDGTVTVGTGGTLTIEPGTVVKFVPDGDSQNSAGISVLNGQLVAQGTPGAPIVFTSVNDDSAGGDTNGGGPAPERGDWGRLNFNADSDAAGAAMQVSLLDNVLVRYGGDGTNCFSSASVGVSARGRLEFTRSEISDSYTAGIDVATLVPGIGIAKFANTKVSDSTCGADVNDGEFLDDVFADSMENYSIYSNQPQALRMAGSFLYTEASINSAPEREEADLRYNALLGGVGAVSGSGIAKDLRYNYWSEEQEELIGQCWDPARNYIPEVDWDGVTPPCSAEHSAVIVDYFTAVLPFMEQLPQEPQTGLGSYPITTDFPELPFELPLEQTFGSGCNCLQEQGQQNFEGDPVNTATGSFTESIVDASFPGPGIRFAFTRTYNSLDETTGPMGPGWTFGYNASLTVLASGKVRVRAEDGQQAVFTPDGGGGFDAPPGITSRLAAAGGGGYRLTKLDLSTLDFNSAGRLIAWQDQSGQGLSFTYGAGKLATVTDAADRTVNLGYTGDMLTSITLPDGRHVDYGYTNGRLTTVTDLRGKTTTFDYDASGWLKTGLDPNGNWLFRNTYNPNSKRVVSQLDARGRETRFEWDGQEQIATTIDPNGGEWEDRYEGRVLMAQTDPLNHTTSYGYDLDLNLTAITDARNNTTTMTYDDAGNLLTRTVPATPGAVPESWEYTAFNKPSSYTNARGKETTFEYFSGTHLLKKVTDPLDRATQFTYTALGLVDTITDPRNEVTDFGYDTDGNLTSVLSPEGNLTTYGYDGSGRRTSMVDPRGNEAGADPADYTTTYDYNNADQVTLVTDPLGHTTGYAFDDAGLLDTVTNAENKVTDYDYYPDNTLDTVTDPRDAEVVYTYDDNGNVDTVTTPAGTTDYGYDAANRRTSEVTPRGNVSGATAANFTWSYGYDANGNLETADHPTAGTTEYSYDELNRVDVVTDALTNQTDYDWDPNGNLKKVTDPLNRVTEYFYDDADQMTKMTDAKTNDTVYGYDGAGNRTSLVTPLGNTYTWSYDGDGRLGSSVDPRGNAAGAVPGDFTTGYDYDAAGHLVQVTDPLGHHTDYAYDPAGNLITRTDANNHATTYSYDPMDRLETVTGPAGTNVGTTSYGYDDTGNLTSRLDANGHTTSWDYDLSGRLIEKETPIGTWTYEYDAESNLKKLVTAAGTATPGDPDDGTITRTYDPANRLTGINYSTGSGTPNVTFAYDELYLTSMTDGAGTETYTYDDAGQLDTITRGTSVIGYDYDALGHVTSRAYSGGPTVTQTWDDDGRPLTLTDPAMSVATTWDEAGNLKTRTWGTGTGAPVTETRSYDNAGRPTMLETLRPTNNLVTRHSYTYDNVGNPLNITHKYGLQGGQENLTYDAANRLTQVCYAATCLVGQRITYTYDPLGNRLTENRVGGTGAGIVTSTYDPDTDQLIQTSRPGTLLGGPIVTNYAYDANGNQTQAGNRTFTYDLENRTTSTTSAAVTTSYTYDGNGHRLSATTGTGPTTSYRWDPNYPLPELASETTAGATRRYIDDASGDPVGLVIPGTGNGTGPHNLHGDALGSVGAATDAATAATRGTWAYEPFGTNRTSPTNQNNLANPVKYAGEYQDGTTGLYHLRARDYDTTTGRFTGLDPIAQDLTDPHVSEYLYVNNRPTSLIDPSGRRACSPSTTSSTSAPCSEDNGPYVVGVEAIAERHGLSPIDVALYLLQRGITYPVAMDQLGGELYPVTADGRVLDCIQVGDFYGAPLDYGQTGVDWAPYYMWSGGELVPTNHATDDGPTPFGLLITQWGLAMGGAYTAAAGAEIYVAGGLFVGGSLMVVGTGFLVGAYALEYSDAAD